MIDIASKVFTKRIEDYEWQLIVDEYSRSESSNYTRLLCTMKIKRVSRNYDDNIYGRSSSSYVQFKVNGKTAKQYVSYDLRGSSIGTTKTLAANYFTVYHNKNGQKTINFEVMHCTNSRLSNVYISDSYTITPIPKCSILSDYADYVTIDIGDTAWVGINTYMENATHDVYMQTSSSGWVKIGSNLTGFLIGEDYNTRGSHYLTVPVTFKNYVSKQSTGRVNLRLDTFYNGIKVGSTYKSNVWAIKNQDCDLNISQFYIVGDTYKEGNDYIAGETAFKTYLYTKGTLSPKSIKYTISGANSQEKTVTVNSRYHTWTSNVMPNKGSTAITATVTDSAGHTVSKTITANLVDDSDLKVTSITPSGTQHTNGSFAKSKPVTFSVKYTASKSKIKKVRYRVNNGSEKYVSVGTDSANFTHTFSRIGINDVTVTIWDQYNNTATKTIQVNIDNNKDDLVINEMYSSGYLDNDNVYVTHGLGSNIIGETITIKYKSNYPITNVQVRTEGDYYSGWRNISRPSRGTGDWNQTEAHWRPNFSIWHNTITIVVRVTDMSGAHKEAKIKIRYNSTLKVPSWTYQDNDQGIFIEEGNKMYFTGTSTDAKDYKIFYAVAHTNLFEVERYCRHYWHYHYGYWCCSRSRLQQLLLQNIDPSTFRLHVFKDFDEDITNKPMWQSGKRFYMYPQNVSKHYALQFFEHAKPGDTILVFAIERRWVNSLAAYSYSSTESYITKDTMKPMCTLPYDPPELTLGVKENTPNKLVLSYKNPLNDTRFNNIDLKFLVDVCLVVKDKNGNIVNGPNPGKRDAKNGRTWIRYSDRKWHHCFSPYAMPHYNFHVFDTEFDLTSYPADCTYCAVAFYYANHHRFPSIYSTSNIVSVVKQDLDLQLKFLTPTDNTMVGDRNPEVKVEVSLPPNNILSNSHLIYDTSFDFAANFKKDKWDAEPIIFNVNRTCDYHLPHFHMNHYHYHHYYHRHYGWHHALYCDHDWFWDCRWLYHNRYEHLNMTIDPPDNVLLINKYKDYRLCLECRSNTFDEVQVNDLGDINTFELLQNKKYTFTYKKPVVDGNYLLNPGDNQLALYVNPYVDDSTDVFYYTTSGEWITRKQFQSEILLTGNPYLNNSFMLPDDVDDFASITNNVLEIRIPKSKIEMGKKYKLKYDFNATRAFHFTNTHDHHCYYPHRIIHCYTYTWVCGHWHKHVIYHPPYYHYHNHCHVPEIHVGNQWISKEIEFTRTSETDDTGDNIIIKFQAVGLERLKFRNFEVVDNAGNPVDIGMPATLDKKKRLHQKKILISYDGFYFNPDYVNPLKADDIHGLRNYLTTLSNDYGCNSYVKNGTFNDAHLSSDDFTLDSWKNWGDLKVYKKQGEEGFADDDTVYLKCPTEREGVSSGIYQEFSSEMIHPDSTITIDYTLHDSTNYDHPTEEQIQEPPAPAPVVPAPPQHIHGLFLYGNFDGPGGHCFTEWSSVHFLMTYHSIVPVTCVRYRVTGQISTGWKHLKRYEFTQFMATGCWFIPHIPVNAIYHCTLHVEVLGSGGYFHTLTRPFVVYARELNFNNINPHVYEYTTPIIRFTGGCWDPATNTTYVHPQAIRESTVDLRVDHNEALFYRYGEGGYYYSIMNDTSTSHPIYFNGYNSTSFYRTSPSYPKTIDINYRTISDGLANELYVIANITGRPGVITQTYHPKLVVSSSFFTQTSPPVIGIGPGILPISEDGEDQIALMTIDNPQARETTVTPRNVGDIEVTFTMPEGTVVNRYNGCMHNGLFVAGQTALQLKIDVKNCSSDKAEIMIDLTGCNEEHEKLILDVDDEGKGVYTWTSQQFHCSGFVNVSVSAKDTNRNKIAYARTSFSVYGNCPFNDRHHFHGDYFYNDDTRDYHTRINSFTTNYLNNLVPAGAKLKLNLDGYGWHYGKVSRIEVFGANNWTKKYSHSNSSDYINKTITLPAAALQNKGITYIRWTLTTDRCVYDDVTCQKTIKCYVYKTHDVMPDPPVIIPEPEPVVMPPASEAYLQYIVNGEIDETVKLSDSGGRKTITLTTRSNHYDAIRIAFTHGGATTAYNRNYLLIVKDVKLSQSVPWRYIPTSAELAEQRKNNAEPFYLEARDLNNTIDYCHTIFSIMKNKNPFGFKGDPEEFDDIERAIPEDTCKSIDTYDGNKDKTYFDDWRKLIDTIRNQSTKKNN